MRRLFRHALPLHTPQHEAGRIQIATGSEPRGPDAAEARWPEIRWPVATFSPICYEANYAYPLLVWLHDDGEDETQMLRLMPQVSRRNYVALGLRAEGPKSGRPGFCWGDAPEHLERAEDELFTAIKAARRRWHVHSERVFLVGVGGGAAAAFWWALRYPDRFAGVAALNGTFPPSRLTPLCRWLDCRRLAIFLSAGCRHAPTRERLLATHRLLYTAGLSMTVHSYACGPEVVPAMLADLDRWVVDRLG